MRINPRDLDTSLVDRMRPEGRNPETVKRYRPLMRAGKMPAPIGWRFDGHVLLSDGGYRTTAAIAEGLPTIEVEIRSGSRQDAVTHAALANLTHGEPPTEAGRREAVLLLLDAGMSPTDAAEATGFSVTQVRGIQAAERVRNATKAPREPVTNSVYQVIARAPEQLWQQLVDTASEFRLPHKELRDLIYQILDADERHSLGAAKCLRTWRKRRAQMGETDHPVLNEVLNRLGMLAPGAKLELFRTLVGDDAMLDRALSDTETAAMIARADVKLAKRLREEQQARQRIRQPGIVDASDFATASASLLKAREAVTTTLHRLRDAELDDDHRQALSELVGWLASAVAWLEARLTTGSLDDELRSLLDNDSDGRG